MAFSADALGFILQAEDKLTPTLEKAAKSYDKFVGQLEKSNRAVYDSASGAMGDVGSLAKALTKLPDQGRRSYESLQKVLSGKAKKPVKQPLDLVFTTKTRRELEKALGTALSRALSGAKIRLQAMIPSNRLAMFDNGAALRTLYKKMVQPPDMGGKLDIPRFKEGGMVTGGKPGKDSVLSLLEPGEFVLPKDVVDRLGALRAETGKFVSPKIIAESLASIETLTKGMERLKEAMDAGFADPKAATMYAKGLEQLDAEVLKLEEHTKDLSYTSRVKLAPTLSKTRAEVAKLTDESEKLVDVSGSLFGSLLGPVRFMALSKALEGVREGFQELRSAGTEAYSELAGQQIDDVRTNVNQMNASLGLSRKELAGIQHAAVLAADGIDGVNPGELSESMQSLAEAGVRSVEQLTKLGGVTAAATKGFGVARDDVAQFGYALTGTYKMSEEQFTGVLSSIGNLSAKYNVSAQTLLQQTRDNMEVLASSMSKMTAEQSASLLNSFNRVGAALPSMFVGSSDKIRDVLARAFEGGPENAEAMRQASMMTGQSIDAVREKLVSGDLAGLFAGMNESLASLDPSSLAAVASTLDMTSADLLRASRDSAQLNATMIESQKALVGAGDGLAYVTQRAKDNTSSFDALKEATSENVGLLNAFGVSGTDVINFFAEFNAQALLSLTYMTAMAVDKLPALIGGFKSMGGWLGKLGKSMGVLKGAQQATTTVTTVAGGAAGAAGTGGFFAGLSAGMTALAGGIGALGTVLLSPPGIAFSVTLVAAILAIGGALWMADGAIKAVVPLLQTLVEVIGSTLMHAMSSLVELFKAGMPVIVQALTVIGDVYKTAIAGVVDIFKTLITADYSKLLVAGPAFGGMAAGLLALAGAVGVYGVALGGLQVSQGLLSLFTGNDTGAGVFGVVDTLAQSLMATTTGPTQYSALVAQIDAMSGFVRAYVTLAREVSSMPGDSLFRMGRSAAEKFRDSAEPLLDAIGATARKAALVGQSAITASITPAQIQNVIDAVVRNPGADEARKLQRETNELLSRILDKIAQAPAPSVTASRNTTPPRNVSSVTRDISAYGY